MTNRLHIVFVLALAVAGLAYQHAYVDMVGHWLNNDTFVHGIIVAPIVLWLLWRERARLREVTLQPSALGLVAVLAVSALWFAGRTLEANIVEHVAAVLLVPAIALAIYGPALVRCAAFAFGYLLFAVPVGEVLVPALMQFTADFTVSALKLTGIAVYREGFRFSTTIGEFSVEKACSGVRYLIASLAAGVLFAHLVFRTRRMKLIFVALSIVVPIIANGIRAWLIVVIAHASDLKFAVGIDHFIYGWVLFGLVMLVLFRVGIAMRRRERPPAPGAGLPPGEGLSAAAADARPFAVVAVCLATMLALAAAPMMLDALGGPAVIRDAWGLRAY